MVLCTGEKIGVSDLPRDFKETVYETQNLYGIPENAKLQETLAGIEKKMIQRSMKLADNVQSEAAALLGIGKSGLNKKLRKYGMI